MIDVALGNEYRVRDANHQRFKQNVQGLLRYRPAVKDCLIARHGVDQNRDRVPAIAAHMLSNHWSALAAGHSESSARQQCDR